MHETLKATKGGPQHVGKDTLRHSTCYFQNIFCVFVLQFCFLKGKMPTHMDVYNNKEKQSIAVNSLIVLFLCIQNLNLY